MLDDGDLSPRHAASACFRMPSFGVYGAVELPGSCRGHRKVCSLLQHTSDLLNLLIQEQDLLKVGVNIYM